MPIGVTVTTTESPQSGGPPTNTGTAFFAGACDKGSGTVPVKVASISDYIAAFGPRTATSATLYDAVDTFFRELGRQAYILRVTDASAVQAALTLQDISVAPKPTVVVTATSPGLAGNFVKATVTNGTAATFTANTATSTALTNISSFANLAPGTAITGTGIAAGTYVLSVNTGAGTAVLSAATTATATGVVITPTTFTVTLNDVTTGNLLETHGPFYATTQLFADTSAYVTFSQSAGSGFTIAAPVAAAAAPLTGGADSSTLTPASYPATLANFPSSLGPGTVALPGQNTSVAWNGLIAHAAANNRFYVLDLPDSPIAATLVASLGTTGQGANALYGVVTASSVIVPGITPGTTRTVPGSAVVAALRARVSATTNDNQAPAGRNWGLQYVSSFTNTFNDADTSTLNAAGINAWAIRFGVSCLFGWVTPVLPSIDAIFWQASASTERMSLVADMQAAGEPFLFQVLDGRGLTLSSFQGALQAVIARHWLNNSLFGNTVQEAGRVHVETPINTPATIAAGQMNAQVQVRVSPFAQTVNITLQFVPVTLPVT